MCEVASTAITPVAGVGEAASSRSFSRSPGDNEEPRESVEILERSLESLVVSDSSEEGILMGRIPRGVEGDGAEQLDEECEDREVLIAANESEVANSAFKAEEQEGGGKEATEKRKKRRISSRRTRTVKLSDSGRVYCEIAGVQVTLVTS